MTDTRLELWIEALETSLNDAIRKIDILASVLSSYQFGDPRVSDIKMSVLDRLEALEKDGKAPTEA